LERGAALGPTVVIGITENPHMTELDRGRLAEGIINAEESKRYL
jgi:hypothetical protein